MQVTHIEVKVSFQSLLGSQVKRSASSSMLSPLSPCNHSDTDRDQMESRLTFHQSADGTASWGSLNPSLKESQWHCIRLTVNLNFEARLILFNHEVLQASFLFTDFRLLVPNYTAFDFLRLNGFTQFGSFLWNRLIFPAISVNFESSDWLIWILISTSVNAITWSVLRLLREVDVSQPILDCFYGWVILPFWTNLCLFLFFIR